MFGDKEDDQSKRELEKLEQLYTWEKLILTQ